MIFFRIGVRKREDRRIFLCLRQLCTGVLGLALLPVSPSAGQSAESDGSQSETLRGTVVNAVTQAPIPRALVYSADNRYAVLTDGDGHFEFTVPTSAS
ncbi:MAG: hypothetical protein ACXV99_15310, partial [Candidatus Angelobacter sp.]